MQLLILQSNLSKYNALGGFKIMKTETVFTNTEMNKCEALNIFKLLPLEFIILILVRRLPLVEAPLKPIFEYGA